MSGGAYDYAYSRVQDMADRMVPRTPVRKAFRDHLRAVAEVMRAVEWADSADTSDEEADHAIRELLGDAVELRAAYELACEAQANLVAAILRYEAKEEHDAKR